MDSHGRCRDTRNKRDMLIGSDSNLTSDLDHSAAVLTEAQPKKMGKRMGCVSWSSIRNNTKMFL